MAFIQKPSTPLWRESVYSWAGGETLKQGDEMSNTITITISDDRLQKLQAMATRLDISVEELILIGVEELLTQPEDKLQMPVDYVLKKNAELDQRLF